MRIYQDAGAPIPWRTLGDALFEMGASSVSFPSNEELEAAAEPSGCSQDWLGGVTRPQTSEGAVAMLTFTVAGGRDVHTTLEDACDMVGLDCFGESATTN